MSSSLLKFSSRHYFFGLILRALIFSLVLNLPAIMLVLRDRHSAVSTFCDPDEGGYLWESKALGQGRSMGSLYFEHDKPTPISSSAYIPEVYGRKVIGSLAAELGLSIVNYNLLLDITLTFLSFVLFSVFFRSFIPSSLAAEMGTICLLAFPWMFTLINYFNITSRLLQRWGVPFFVSDSCLPVQRAVSTQLSYPLVAAVLIAASSVLSKFPGNKKNIVLLGALSGALIYVRFFAWIAMLAVLGLWYLSIRAPQLKKSFLYFRAFTAELFIFCLIHLSIAYPALRQIFPSSVPGLNITAPASSGALAGALPLFDSWFFSLEELALLILVFFGGLIISRKGRSCVVPKFLASLIVAEFFLTNLEPLLQRPLSGIQFLVFYTQPLLGGTLFACLVTAMLSLDRRARLTYLAMTIFTVSFGAGIIRQIYYQKPASNWVALIEHLENPHLDKQVLAVLPTLNPFDQPTAQPFNREEPQVVASVAGNYLLFESWYTTTGAGIAEQMEREYLLSWLYSGRLAPVAACPDATIKIPQDAHFRPWIGNLTLRQTQCRFFENTKNPPNLCDLLSRYKLDLILWEKEFNLSPDHLPGLVQQIWESKDQAMILYRFDQAKAISQFCLNDRVASEKR